MYLSYVLIECARCTYVSVDVILRQVYPRGRFKVVPYRARKSLSEIRLYALSYGIKAYAFIATCNTVQKQNDLKLLTRRVRVRRCAVFDPVWYQFILMTPRKKCIFPVVVKR